jgi:hypothetical protein
VGTMLPPFRIVEGVFWLLSLAALLPMASAQWLAASTVRSAAVFRAFVADLWRGEFR